MHFIDGKKISENILKDIKKQIKLNGLEPWLAVILVGDDPASGIYVKLKEKRSQEVGIRVQKFFLPKIVKEKELLEIIDFLNRNSKINGILVQLPLPNHLTTDKIIKKINPDKDIDGFLHSSNFDPPFILAIWRSIQATKINLKNKKIVALVNSKIFGNKLQDFFKEKEIKINYFLSKKNNLNKLKQADIVITACGKPDLINSSHIKDGAILIDGGVSKRNGEVRGDINKENVAGKAAWLTPVPGGTGPLTIAFLLKNVLKSYKLSS